MTTTTTMTIRVVSRHTTKTYIWTLINLKRSFTKQLSGLLSAPSQPPAHRLRFGRSTADIARFTNSSTYLLTYCLAACPGVFRDLRLGIETPFSKSWTWPWFWSLKFGGLCLDLKSSSLGLEGRSLGLELGKLSLEIQAFGRYVCMHPPVLEKLVSDVFCGDLKHYRNYRRREKGEMIWKNWTDEKDNVFNSLELIYYIRTT